MTKYFCDMCGGELNIDKDLVNIDFNSFKTAHTKLTEKTNGIEPNFQLCVECAYSIYRKIKDRPKRVLDDKDGD